MLFHFIFLSHSFSLLVMPFFFYLFMYLFFLSVSVCPSLLSPLLFLSHHFFLSLSPPPSHHLSLVPSFSLYLAPSLLVCLSLPSPIFDTPPVSALMGGVRSRCVFLAEGMRVSVSTSRGVSVLLWIITPSSLHNACDSSSILSAAKNTSPLPSSASQDYPNVLPKPQSQFTMKDGDRYPLGYDFLNTTPCPVPATQRCFNFPVLNLTVERTDLLFPALPYRLFSPMLMRILSAAYQCVVLFPPFSSFLFPSLLVLV